jgi:transposase
MTMSMQEPLFGPYPIPEDTRRVAHAAFPKGNLYLQLRDRCGMLFDNQRFAHLFSREGQPALAPARLALVLIFQFLETLSDREAADAVRDRISWKYALGLPLDDPGFDYSVLSEFRARLLKADAEALLFDTVLELAQELGLLKARGKQRTDSTHVLAAIRELHRLEHVGETLRHALNTLAVAAPVWLRAHVDPAWGERYGTRIEQYRLPKADVEREALARTIGHDGSCLLAALDADSALSSEVRTLPAVETLRQVWAQQYITDETEDGPLLRLRTRAEQPPSAELISSPYDPEARYRTKRETSWLGYAVHLTETCEDDLPNLITHVATTPNTTADCALTATIQADLATKDLLPDEHYVDSAYLDAGILVESQRKHAVTMVGPVSTDPSWQAHTPDGLTAAQFAFDWEAEQVLCPAGRLSESWQPSKDTHGNAMIVIRFAAEDCQACALRARCTKATTGGRGLSVRPREQHIALQAARVSQEGEEFRRKYKRRAGIEGTFTQGNRRCDLRHARYIGQAKTHLQHLLTAIAINLLRLIAWLTEVPRAETRTSPFAVLMANRSLALAYS